MQSFLHSPLIMEATEGSQRVCLSSGGRGTTWSRSYGYIVSRLITRISEHRASVQYVSSFRKDDLGSNKKGGKENCLECEEEKEEPNIVRSLPEGMFAMTRQRICVRCSGSPQNPLISPTRTRGGIK
ncbi:hypothetical protein TNCV_1370161 [Trichonephila clavipes]|nr:hypothetical protein TNCV_1370161 [Trichonephila clavipes]